MENIKLIRHAAENNIMNSLKGMSVKEAKLTLQSILLRLDEKIQITAESFTTKSSNESFITE